jgi:membrane protein DedA with SNARE-associated domain
VLFLAALLEAVPVFGSFIPGSTVILGLSALVATGQLHGAAVLASIVAGAALGDGAAFWLGHRHPDVFRRIWPLNRHPDLVAHSEAFFRDHGGKAVFLARFLPPVRAFVPITAGALGMPPRRFFPLNLVAIALWGPAHVGPGVLAGTIYAKAGAMADQLLLPVVAGLVAIGLLLWAARWLVRRHRAHSGTSAAAGG